MLYLEPLFDRVLIKRKVLTKTQGGIFLPETSKEAKVSIGEVVSIGEDCCTLKPGDVVTFGKYSSHAVDTKETDLYGLDIKGDEEHEMLMIIEADALCIVRQKLVSDFVRGDFSEVENG